MSTMSNRNRIYVVEIMKINIFSISKYFDINELTGPTRAADSVSESVM